MTHQATQIIKALSTFHISDEDRQTVLDALELPFVEGLDDAVQTLSHELQNMARDPELMEATYKVLDAAEEYIKRMKKKK